MMVIIANWCVLVILQLTVDLTDVDHVVFHPIIAQKQDQLSTLEAYKKSLIYEYVTGKKEVPAQ